MGDGVDVVKPTQGSTMTQLAIALGNIQYGQSRDIFLRYAEKPPWASRVAPEPAESIQEEGEKTETGSGADDFLVIDKPSDTPSGTTISVSLSYQRMTPLLHSVTSTQNLETPTTTLSAEEAAYHVSRAAIVSFVSDLFPLRWDVEHEAKPWWDSTHPHLLDTMLSKTPFPAKCFSDPLNTSLMRDLEGEAPHGQLRLALSQKAFWEKWGVHYLPSLAGAHARQVCNSFKDPGPLQYGTGSPLFVRCRDRLDELFDTLPPPKPSNVGNEYGAQFMESGYEFGGPGLAQIDMHDYHRINNPCFAGFCAVAVPGGQAVKMEKLRGGMEVVTPRGSRKVRAVLKTRVSREAMVRVGGMVVTPWHPIREAGSRAWVFPPAVAQGRVRYTGSIYSVLLEPDTDADAHAIMVGGVWGVSLGHGIIRGHDVRAHRFLGDYRSVSLALACLGVSKDGLAASGGVVRDHKTGRVCGFRKAPPLRVP